MTPMMGSLQRPDAAVGRRLAVAQVQVVGEHEEAVLQLALVVAAKDPQARLPLLGWAWQVLTVAPAN